MPGRTPGAARPLAPAVGGVPAVQPSPAPAANGAPARRPVGSAGPPTEIQRRPFTPPPGSVASRAAGGSVLNPAGSQAVLGQVNGARSVMRGANRRPLPQGQVTVHDNGGLTLNAGGRRYEVRANGALASYRANGLTAAFRPDGRLRSLQTPDMEIRHGGRGGRVIAVHRPDHTVLVSTGPRSGYLERPLVLGNRSFIHRTYVFHGAASARFFRPYRYHGLTLPAYIAQAYYPAAFYGWMSYPWQRPVAYAWPWLGRPWYGMYRGYFAPAPYYPGAYLWLTDYVLAETMAAGYEDDSQPGDDASYTAASLPGDAELPADDELYADADTPIGAELKAAIAEELRQQIAAEVAMSNGDQDPSQVDLPGSLKPNRLFVASQNLEVKTTGQRTCELSHGDVLRLIATPPEGASTASLRVVAGKRYDCPAGAQVTVSLQDLQEMQNDLRAQLDAGLDALCGGQGRDGLPAAPPAAMAPARPGTPGAPGAEAGVEAMLTAEQRQAGQAESSVAQAVGN